MTKLQEFTAFAGSKPANEKYDYMNTCGGCAMGQWMAATGVAWDINTYSDLVSELLHNDSEPLIKGKNWGDLHKRLKAFEPV